MIKSQPFSKLLALAVPMLIFAGVGRAQATRTWVSGVGDDANPCSRTAPCKTFAGAISKTAASGEIDCLDPGGFGAVTITKAITIDCNATLGSVLVSGTNGIVIQAGLNDEVRLRHISINGVGTGLNGVRVLSAASVELEDVAINDFTQTCVDVETGTAASLLRIENSSFSNCVTGLFMQTTAAVTVNADLHNTRIWDNSNGVVANNGSRITIRDSIISRAITAGISQPNQVGGVGSTVNIVGSTVSSCVVALLSSGGAVLTASGDTFSNNLTVFNPNGGTILTGQDNVSFGNVTIGTATPTSKI